MWLNLIPPWNVIIFLLFSHWLTQSPRVWQKVPFCSENGSTTSIKRHVVHGGERVVTYCRIWPVIADCHTFGWYLNSGSKNLGLLKGIVSRDFLLWFFHETTSTSPVRHAKKGFRIFSNIRGVIRSRNGLRESPVNSPPPPWSHDSPVMNTLGVDLNWFTKKATGANIRESRLLCD